MVLAYEDFGNNEIFDDDLYDLKQEYIVTRESNFGCLESESIFDKDGGNHEIKITKNDIANSKVEFSTSGKLEINSDKLVSNMELGAVFDKGEETLSLSGDYVMEQWRTKTTIDASAKGVLGLSNETVISSDGVSVGISFQVDKTASISEYNAAVSWEVDESATYTTQTVNNCKSMLFTCVKKVGTDTEVAGRLTYDFDREVTDMSLGAKFPVLGGLSQWLLESTTAKLLYSKKLSENVNGEFAVNMPIGRGLAGITHGFRLSFS